MARRKQPKTPSVLLPAKEPEKENAGVLKIGMNGAWLEGRHVNGKWKFTCPDWPDLAKKYAGATSIDAIMREFTGRALVGSVEFKQLAFEERA